jgi:hypothetical protein
VAQGRTPALALLKNAMTNHKLLVRASLTIACFRMVDCFMEQFPGRGARATSAAQLRAALIQLKPTFDEHFAFEREYCQICDQLLDCLIEQLLVCQTIFDCTFDIRSDRFLHNFLLNEGSDRATKIMNTIIDLAEQAAQGKPAFLLRA